jgi:hypothetical protein
VGQASQPARVSVAPAERQHAGSSYLTDEEYEARNEAASEAFKRGDFQDAFARYQSLSISLALRFFAEEGVRFIKPPEGPAPTPTELVLGLAAAAHAEFQERGGDQAPMKIATAAWMLAAVGEFRVALEEPIPMRKDAIDTKIAEVTIRAQMVGQIDMFMTAVRLGWFDKLRAFEMERERRRHGAAETKAKKAALHERALGEALRITGVNATLSNEEVAVKVRESLGIATTVKTVTGWVRTWRRKRFLPDQKKTIC